MGRINAKQKLWLKEKYRTESASIGWSESFMDMT